jgi:hypothetical protein
MSLKAKWSIGDVVITNSSIVPFDNLTTEYDVADGELELFFTADGSIPYVKISDYFELLSGFIDPTIDIQFTKTPDSLELYYQYYSEEEDHTYDLYNYYDLETNLITTNDPGFYWAYIYSTETNYGRNIEYLYDSELNEFIEGSNIVYNLNNYYMDLVYYDEDILAPYYLVNQLYAGSSYYNVYYNGQGLYGIYGQVAPGSIEYAKIRRSSNNGKAVPTDLLQHSYDMLAFNLDHFYGLKDYEEVDTYYSVLAQYRNDLLSTDYQKVSQAIADLLLKTLDEPHTSYGFSGYYGSYNYNPPTNSLANYGPRFNSWYMDGLYAVDDAIAAKWNITTTNSSAANNSKRPKYWFIDDESAVISFDEFVTADIEETTTWSDEPYQTLFEEENLLPTLDGGSRYFVFNQSSKTNVITETMVWGLDNTSLDTYKASLVDDGWTLVKEATTKVDYHKDGYYTKTIGDVDYMVTLSFSSKYSTLYIGVTNQIPTVYDNAWALVGDVEALVFSDSAIYLATQILKLTAEKPNVKNIGLDLTFNTGGNVGSLYRILGLMTSEPFAVSSISRDTYSYSTTYITTSYDSNDQYEWFLLSSKATFSAANELVTIFKQNKIGLIIGQVSGGGTASITPILLPDGTFFTMSSNNLNALRDESGEYIINEPGITPDFVIEVDELYDNAILAGILNS